MESRQIFVLAPFFFFGESKLPGISVSIGHICEHALHTETSFTAGPIADRSINGTV